MLLLGGSMNKKLIVTYLTWYYLSQKFIQNKNETIEISIKDIKVKKHK